MNYVDDPMPFIKNVIGADSITKAILHAYELTPPDPEERDNDYRTHLALMEQLCQESAIVPTPLADLKSLLDMMDQFVAQGRRVTQEQEASAELLRQRYVAWCLDTFFEQQV